MTTECEKCKPHRGDRFVWYVCLFIAGWMTSAWMTPEPRFAACVEVMPKQHSTYDMTKQQKNRWIKYYLSKGEK